MFDFHEKRKIRKILYSKGIFILLLIIALLLSHSVYSRFLVSQDTKNKLEERRESLETLEIRAESLDAKVQYLENDRGIEEELRNRFDIAKEGEQVVIIIDDKNAKDKDTASNTKDSDEDGAGWVISIFNLFKFW